ncbi:MAG: 2-amino-4-hydroxy-6-hydroxymethyldihydropteridine pyrophosphokinae [Actinomycetia bacterium]|nr:2-amino-4-hydroxy-6-hydroxymethyldihydropteridine pyrophosphokinae [Actinomycetes bacterium]
MTSDASVIAYIAIGANEGDRRANIHLAIAKIEATEGVRVSKVSSLLDNPAIGGPKSSGDFLNAVVEVHTTLPARFLLARLLEVERELGRIRREKWGPRVIDLDLILYGQEVIAEEGLHVPHPLMHTRKFVLHPLAEIAPDARHPVLKMSARELLDRLGKS